MDPKRPQLPEHPANNQRGSGPPNRNEGGNFGGGNFGGGGGNYGNPHQQGMMGGGGGGGYNQGRPPMMGGGYQGMDENSFAEIVHRSQICWNMIN